MTGLSSKQHLFVRVLLVVGIADSVFFYALLRNPQMLTWQFAFAATAMTLIALAVNLGVWWRYQRRGTVT